MVEIVNDPYIFRAPLSFYAGSIDLEFVVTRDTIPNYGMFTLLTNTDYYAYIGNRDITTLPRYSIALQINKHNEKIITAEIIKALIISDTHIQIETKDRKKYVLPIACYANKSNMVLTFEYILTIFAP